MTLTERAGRSGLFHVGRVKPVSGSDGKVVHVRMVSPVLLQDCIDLLILATAFGWQPFEIEGTFHADVVSLELDTLVPAHGCGSSRVRR